MIQQKRKRVELIDGHVLPYAYGKYICINNLCLKSVARYAATSMIEDYRIRYIMGRFGVFFDDYNMVEPDISVIQNKAKLSNRGCEGAPDWIIEIVMPGDPLHDYVTKLEKYSSVGVREYWIVDGIKQKVTVYCFEQDIYAESHTFNEPVKSYLYKDLAVDFSIMDLRS